MTTRAIIQIGAEVLAETPGHAQYRVNMYELDSQAQPVGLPIVVACATVPVNYLHENDDIVLHSLLTMRGILEQLEQRWYALHPGRTSLLFVQRTAADVED